MEDKSVNSILDPQEFKDKLLEKIEFAFSDSVLKHSLLDMSFEQFTNYVGENFSVQIKGYFWGEKIERVDEIREKNIQLPATFFDYFKHRFFLDWLKKRCPVKYRKYTIKTVKQMSVLNIYPNVRIESDQSRIYLRNLWR